MKQETIHELFSASLILKGINGLLEMVGGIVFASVSLEKINYLLFFIFQGELSNDPNDFIANLILNFSQNLSVSGKIFGSIYLITHGVVKIFLVIALWKRKLWAYPLATVVFSFFIAYQLIRYTYSHFFGLIILTIIDIFVIVFIQLEYKKIKSLQPTI